MFNAIFTIIIIAFIIHIMDVKIYRKALGDTPRNIITILLILLTLHGMGYSKGMGNICGNAYKQFTKGFQESLKQEVIKQEPDKTKEVDHD